MSIQVKKKECFGCKKPKNIWKNYLGKRYCQKCWDKHPEKINPVKSIPKLINKKSDKQKRLDIAYSVLRLQFLKDNPYCQAQLPGCMGKSDQIHHMAGKIGKLYLDTTLWLAVDFNCHRWVTDNGKEAIELGLSESRLDK